MINLNLAMFVKPTSNGTVERIVTTFKSSNKPANAHSSSAVHRADAAPTSLKQGGQENWILEPHVKAGVWVRRGSSRKGGRHSLTEGGLSLVQKGENHLEQSIWGVDKIYQEQRKYYIRTR